MAEPVSNLSYSDVLVESNDVPMDDANGDDLSALLVDEVEDEEARFPQVDKSLEKDCGDSAEKTVNASSSNLSCIRVNLVSTSASNNSPDVNTHPSEFTMMTKTEDVQGEKTEVGSVCSNLSYSDEKDDDDDDDDEVSWSESEGSTYVSDNSVGSHPPPPTSDRPRTTSSKVVQRLTSISNEDRNEQRKLDPPAMTVHTIEISNGTTSLRDGDLQDIVLSDDENPGKLTHQVRSNNRKSRSKSPKARQGSFKSGNKTESKQPRTRSSSLKSNRSDRRRKSTAKGTSRVAMMGSRPRRGQAQEIAYRLLENIDYYSDFEEASASDEVSAIGFISIEDTAAVFCRRLIPLEIPVQDVPSADAGLSAVSDVNDSSVMPSVLADEHTEYAVRTRKGVGTMKLKRKGVEKPRKRKTNSQQGLQLAGVDYYSTVDVATNNHDLSTVGHQMPQRIANAAFESPKLAVPKEIPVVEQSIQDDLSTLYGSVARFPLYEVEVPERKVSLSPLESFSFDDSSRDDGFYGDDGSEAAVRPVQEKRRNRQVDRFDESEKTSKSKNEGNHKTMSTGSTKQSKAEKVISADTMNIEQPSPESPVTPPAPPPPKKKASKKKKTVTVKSEEEDPSKDAPTTSPSQGGEAEWTAKDRIRHLKEKIRAMQQSSTAMDNSSASNDKKSQATSVSSTRDDDAPSKVKNNKAKDEGNGGRPTMTEKSSDASSELTPEMKRIVHKREQKRVEQNEKRRQQLRRERQNVAEEKVENRDSSTSDGRRQDDLSNDERLRLNNVDYFNQVPTASHNNDISTTQSHMPREYANTAFGFTPVPTEVPLRKMDDVSTIHGDIEAPIPTSGRNNSNNNHRSSKHKYQKVRTGTNIDMYIDEEDEEDDEDIVVPTRSVPIKLESSNRGKKNTAVDRLKSGANSYVQKARDCGLALTQKLELIDRERFDGKIRNFLSSVLEGRGTTENIILGIIVVSFVILLILLCLVIANK